MRSWQSETGHLECRWSEAGEHVPYNPPWMQAAGDVPGGLLPVLPDFASHSPFGVSDTWFRWQTPERNSD